MSLEFLVYSSHPVVIDERAVVAELADIGWDAAMPPTYVWIGGARETRPTPLEGLIYGWRQGSSDASHLRELVAQIPLAQPSAREHPRRRLANLTRVVGCEVRGIQFEFGPGELEEYEDVPAALRQRLARTRTQYVLRTGAGRSDVAVQFQEALWLAISKVVDGIRLDPQDGTWT